jgi:hypothetical protein
LQEQRDGALALLSIALALISTAAVLSLFAGQWALFFPYAWLAYLAMEVVAIVLSSVGLVRKTGSRVVSLLALAISGAGISTIPYLFWYSLATMD